MPVLGRNEVGVLRVLLDVVADERAQRDDRKSVPARVGQHFSDEVAAEAAALASGVDLRMRELDAPVVAAVLRATDESPVEA